jgi:hypothetical protein
VEKLNEQVGAIKDENRSEYLTGDQAFAPKPGERGSTDAHKFTLVRLNYRFRFFGLTSLRYRSYRADNDTHLSNR